MIIEEEQRMDVKVRLQINGNDKEVILNEDIKLQELNDTLIYDQKDKEYISLLAFYELLSDADKCLKDKINVVLVYQHLKKKDVALDNYLKQHPYVNLIKISR